MVNANRGRVNKTEVLWKSNGWIWNEEEAEHETTNRDVQKDGGRQSLLEKEGYEQNTEIDREELTDTEVQDSAGIRMWTVFSFRRSEDATAYRSS